MKTEFEKSIDDVLKDLQMKKVEYEECSVLSNPNWEYFRGKKDAYEFACKLLKRAIEWHQPK